MFRKVSLCLLTLFVTALTVADDVVVRNTRAQKLLVLNSGRVFAGQLIPRTDGYDVILPSGRMYVSNDRIRFLAVGMQDAYEKMSDSVQHKTPLIHVQMARWCLTNGLRSQARRELLDALHLDPDYSLAKSMLEALTRQEKQVQSQVQDQSDISAAMAAHQAGIVDRRSLGGLPGETARTFTVRIQSLLSNNCGNTNCHGGEDNRFAFTYVRGDSSVVIAEQNLAAVLKQIDVSDPLSSPLVVKAQTMHGGARTPLFSGRAGRFQLQSLRDWVQEVSAEMNPSLAAVGARPTSGDVGQTETEVAGNSSMVRASLELPQAPAMPIDGVKVQARLKSETDGEFRRDAMEATRNDPFDPMIFNRRYHGKTRSSR